MDSERRTSSDRRSEDLNEAAVKAVFDKLGIDGDDISDLRAFRKDLEWARYNRTRCDSLSGKVVTFLFITATASGLAFIWEAVRQKLGIE